MGKREGLINLTTTSSAAPEQNIALWCVPYTVLYALHCAIHGTFHCKAYTVILSAECSEHESLQVTMGALLLPYSGATLNFLVTIFMAAHCGTRGGGGGFAQSRPWAAFSRPTWENFTFCQLLPAFFPIFPNVDYLIHASACLLCCNWATSSALLPLTRCTHTHNFWLFSNILFLYLKLSEW